MQPKPRGRPCTPLDPNASKAARLGCDVQTLRRKRGLSQGALGELIGYSAQHVSDIERARACVALSCIAAIDDALDAKGALVALQPAVSAERDAARQARAAARRGEAELLASLRCVLSDAGDDDVELTTRLGLLEAGGAAALGAATIGPAPARAGQVDPGLVDHWTNLLALLGRLDARYGPRDVLAAVTREIELIAAYREAARGALRMELMRVEARWCEFAAWLSNDTGDTRSRDTWTVRAASLAQTANYADMAALTRERRAQWAAQEHDARRTIAFAEDALRIPGTSAQTRALCTRQAACGHALSGDISACERRLAEVEAIVDRADDTAPPWTGGRVDRHLVRSSAARCWLALEPCRAIPLYEAVLRDWPRERIRTGALQRARLALACAQVGELDRAEAEGRRAFASARATGSALAMRELRRLGLALKAA